MSLVNLTLPEFAFVHGSEHEEDILKGRSVFLHIRSNTMLELFSKQDGVVINDDVKTYHFEYVNMFGVIEDLFIAVHYTFDEGNISSILEKSSEWFMDYCRWEDRNIDLED